MSLPIVGGQFECRTARFADVVHKPDSDAGGMRDVLELAGDDADRGIVERRNRTRSSKHWKPIPALQGL